MLKLLEDPKYPLLGPHLRLLKFTGLWHPALDRVARLKLLLFCVTTSFFCSQYVKCVLFLNVDSIKLILQYIPFHIGIVKACFFKKHYANWSRLIESISEIERHQMLQKDITIHIKNYIHRSRRVTFFFWALAFFSNFSIFTEPYRKNHVGNGTDSYLYLFDGYTPFDRVPPGYYCSMFVQTVLGHVVSAYVVGWDTCVVSIMIFFAGQLKILRIYNMKIFCYKNNVTSFKNIANCHGFYMKLIEYHKLFNSLISTVMFIYLIVISVNLGVCIIQIAEIQDDLGAFLSAYLYIVACLIQLLLFYWYSNEVTHESQLVSYSLFESDWYYAPTILQRNIALLAETTNRRFVFKAGPYYEMSLATFVSILRTSYSFFTLLNETN
ncbi:unnamed protein product [Pieris macdunnoughi]|uniref:Odorant receptor n=1 Tax=Pieris macdunnoughi TaxID=345717 RepID=A0A821LTW9_9NEOP|nr:unnamed protein product [Pieris macdunnoughi]